MDYDIVFYEAFKEEENELKELFKDKDFKLYYTFETIQETPKDIKGRLVSIRTQSLLPLEMASYIEGIVTRSTGYDHITDYRKRLKEAKIPHKMKFCHLPDYSKRSCGEHAMMMWTVLLKKLKRQMKQLKTFYRDNLTGNEIMGKRIAVIGVGRIGGEVVKIAKGLQMDVVGCDLVENEELKKDWNLKYLPLEDALKGADIVVCALCLTKITEGMLNYDLLSRTMKNGSIFVNVSRGECSPTKDLFRLLEEGKLAGLGLDVYEEEKAIAAVLRKEMKLEDIQDQKVKEIVDLTLKMMEMENVMFTPHNAFNSEESVIRKSKRSFENICEYMEKGEFLTPVPMVEI